MYNLKPEESTGEYLWDPGQCKYFFCKEKQINLTTLSKFKTSAWNPLLQQNV